MFVVTEADAAAIRDVFHQEGELSAAIELRPAIPRDHRQREGASMRPNYRRFDAAARTTPSGDAVAPL
jgi:hypothetical protein